MLESFSDAYSIHATSNLRIIKSAQVHITPSPNSDDLASLIIPIQYLPKTIFSAGARENDRPTVMSMREGAQMIGTSLFENQQHRSAKPRSEQI